MAIGKPLLACAMLGASATGAVAQAYVGLFAVQAIQQDEKRREDACQAGEPPSPGMAASVEKQAEARLTEYFAQAGVSNGQRAIARLFIDSGSLARWMGPDGAQPVKSIVDPAGALRPYGTLTRKAFVVSNDAQSARGVWALTVADGADPSKTDTYEYGVDFIAGSWAGIWLWHVHLYRGAGSAPPPPDKFCHIDPASAY